MDYGEERREEERKPLVLDSEYEFNGALCPCKIINLASRSITLNVKEPLIVGNSIKIVLGKEIITAKVIRVDGDVAGAMFDKLSDEQLDYILKLKNV